MTTMISDVEAADCLPTRIGEYLILGLLGASDEMGLPEEEKPMAQVFLAERPKHGDQVALKLAREFTARDPRRLAQFEIEISAALKLVHPNIVRAYTRGVHRQRPYFVMEYIAGGTLREKECREHFRNADALLALMLKVTSAVAFAHAREVVHNDLKPANILINEEGEPFLIDFGIAGRDGQLSPVSGGTVGFGLSEEKKALRQEPNDVVCLGGVFYTLVREASTFTSGARLSSVERRRQTLLLENLAAVCEHAKRDDRYESAAALEADLRILRDGGSVLPIPWPSRCYDWALVHPVLASLLFLLLSFAIFVPLRMGTLAENQRKRSIEDSELLLKAHARSLASLLERELKRAGEILAQLASAEAATLMSKSADAVEPAAVAFARRFGMFDSVFTVDSECRSKNYWPPPFVSPHDHVRWRDYCERIRLGREKPYVGRSYYFEKTGQPPRLRLPISVPIKGPDGRMVGVLVGARDATDMKLINFGLAPGTQSAVVAAKDLSSDPDEAPAGQPRPERPRDWELIAQSGLSNALAILQAAGRESIVDAHGRSSCSVPDTLPIVTKPANLASAVPSQLMVALAPVGATGLCVVQVATLTSATSPTAPLRKEAVLIGWLVAGATSLLALLIVLSTRRRKAAR